MWNTVISALIACVISVIGSGLAVLTTPGVDSLDDIKPITWIIIGLTSFLAFLKDFQTIWTRAMVNKVTGSGDGGGSGPLPTKVPTPEGNPK